MLKCCKKFEIKKLEVRSLLTLLYCFTQRRGGANLDVKNLIMKTKTMTEELRLNTFFSRKDANLPAGKQGRKVERKKPNNDN
ncbi:hypothetical protein GCM10023314_28090 [Algibacter agarivorans]|uniref:Uncharacterized protein n=1 Tax=Algibacter agarivorans TaxID=1109741 RepID=A0ABP9GXJ9_9FLAO